MRREVLPVLQQAHVLAQKEQEAEKELQTLRGELEQAREEAASVARQRVIIARELRQIDELRRALDQRQCELAQAVATDRRLQQQLREQD